MDIFYNFIHVCHRIVTFHFLKRPVFVDANISMNRLQLRFCFVTHTIILVVSKGQTRREAGTQSHGSRLAGPPDRRIRSRRFLFSLGKEVVSSI